MSLTSSFTALPFNKKQTRMDALLVLDISALVSLPFSARLLLNTSIFGNYDLLIGLVHQYQHDHHRQISDSTEAIINLTIEGIEKMISINGSPKAEGGANEAAAAVITINPAIKRHFELEIKTLQDAPRDADKLQRLLQIRQRQYQKATQIEDIQNLVTEIEMLKFVLFLVCRKCGKQNQKH